MFECYPPHLCRILELARWAPSGDNTQPWRFEVLGEEHLLVHGFDTRDHVVYDLDGHASQLAVGALLETLAISATTEGRRADIHRRPSCSDTHLEYDVYLHRDDSIVPNSLAKYIQQRVVQRRALSTRRLESGQKKALASSLPPGYQVVWFEGLGQRWRLARFMFDNAKIRLTIPEAYLVHKTVIEWGARYSEDRIPEHAVGVDAVTAKIMRWAMVSWNRVKALNTFFLGHLPPRIQLDLIPGVRCGAHFALLAPEPPESVDHHVDFGRVVQRFWLTATSLGLLIQPEMTPVIFTRYHRSGLGFTHLASANVMVKHLDERLEGLLVGHDRKALFFMGRIGAGPQPVSRSLRRPLAEMMLGDRT